MPGCGIIITVRSSSTRLPRKAWHEIQGRPLICHLVERVKQIKGYQQVVIATTDQPEDKAFSEVADRYGIGIYYGHPTDIMQRQLDAARLYDLDFYVTADGDDLFCDHYCYEKVLSDFIKTNADYIKPDGFIIGTYAYGIKVKALEKICRLKDDPQTEGFGRYFEQVPGFKLSSVKNKPERYIPGLRLTIDYPEDIKLVQALVDKINKSVKDILIEDIVKTCLELPGLLKINSHLEEIYWRNFKEKYSSVRLKGEV